MWEADMEKAVELKARSFVNLLPDLSRRILHSTHRLAKGDLSIDPEKRSDFL